MSSEVVWCHMWLGAFTADLGDYERAVHHTGVGLDLAVTDASPTAIVYLANQHAENAMAASRLLDDDSYIEIARGAYDLADLHGTHAGIEEGLIRAANGRALLTATTDPAGALAECEIALVEWR